MLGMSNVSSIYSVVPGGTVLRRAITPVVPFSFSAASHTLEISEAPSGLEGVGKDRGVR